MNTPNLAQAALIVIDVQLGFNDPVWGERNNPAFEANLTRLLDLWRANGAPIIHVQHDSLEPDSTLRAGHPGFPFTAEATPQEGEPVFVKNVNSAFIGTELESYLRTQGIEQLVVTGLTTDHCVSTSVRMAGNFGFQVWLVGDGTATFPRRGPDGNLYSADDIHHIHLTSLNDEFCTVISTDALATQ